MYTAFTFNVNTVYSQPPIKLQSAMAVAKKAYHHGELRESLLSAAGALLEQDGPAGLSLRKVGRQLGVTPGAPYRHFEDKDALLAALATEGFRKLRAAILANQEGAPDGQERLRRAGLGYLEFASSHPELFRLMFGWMPARGRCGLRCFREHPRDLRGGRPLVSERARSRPTHLVGRTRRGILGDRWAPPAGRTDAERGVRPQPPARQPLVGHRSTLVVRHRERVSRTTPRARQSYDAASASMNASS
jgi:AcrR family transcriptional regulator